MPRVTLLVALLALSLPAVCLAQNNGPVVDPVQRAVTQARNEGRFLDAQKLLKDAVAELEQSDPENPRLAQYLKELAALVARTEGESAAGPLLRRAYEIDRSAFGPTDLRVANDLTLVAHNEQAAGDLKEAERNIGEAVAIVRSYKEKLRWNAGAGLAAGVFGVAVSFYMHEKRWVDAEILMPDETKLCELVPEEYKVGFGLCARIPETIAEIYRGEGKTVETVERPASSNIPPEIAALNQAAEKFANDGVFPSAEEAYERAIALGRKIDSSQSGFGTLEASEMDDLGQLYEREGLRDRAEQSYTAALAIGEKQVSLHPGHAGFATSLRPAMLATLYRNEGRLQDAEAVVRRVLGDQEASLGERHRAIVETLTTLADIVEQEGADAPAKLGQARTIYERAIAIQESNVGPDDPMLLGLLQRYAELLAKLKDDSGAARIRARISLIQSKHDSAR